MDITDITYHDLIDGCYSNSKELQRIIDALEDLLVDIKRHKRNVDNE